MKRRLPLLAAVPILAALLGLADPIGGALAAKPSQKPSRARATTFEACRHGCRYRTIQKAVDSAGVYAWRHKGAKVTVAIRPGRYVEGVVVDGTEPHKAFDGMTIEGTEQDRERTILEGKDAKGGPGAVQDGIEAIGVDGLVLKNMWARNFGSSGFSIEASGAEDRPCEGFTMENLLASGNRSYGLLATGCLGGEMTDSAAYRQGVAGFGVQETPCDSAQWSVYDGVPCQAKPRGTLLRNDESHENAIGFSGANAKYAQVLENAFFDNGTGIVTDTVSGGGGHAPNGWNVIERNDVFWNNYDYFLAGSAIHTDTDGFGEMNGQTLNYPTGVGIVLYGSDHDIVRGNRVFGNYKWGIASFSGPGETLVVDRADETKNVDNEIAGNVLGRGGADPNGEYDLFNDATGGGNCWGANSTNSTFAPGNGKVPSSLIYPVCPQAPIEYAAAKSLNTTAGLQTSLAEPANPSTVLGYAGTNPPQDQQCTWVRRIAVHPAFQDFKPAEVTSQPGEVSCARP